MSHLLIVTSMILNVYIVFSPVFLPIYNSSLSVFAVKQHRLWCDEQFRDVSDGSGLMSTMWRSGTRAMSRV